LAKASFDEISVIGFKDAQAGVEIFAFGDDDDVEPWRNLISTKYLSNQSFSSVSLYRAADFSCRRDSEPTHTALVGQDKNGAVAAVESNTLFVDLLEFRPTADVFS